jgi:hypothetical protein
MKRLLTVSVAALTIGVLPGSPRRAPSSRSVSPGAKSASQRTAPETRSFAYASAQDGVGAETVTRNGDVISGDMAIEAKHVHYEGRIAADGTIPRLEMRVWRSAAEAKHPRVLSAIVGRDSIKLIEHLATRVDTLRFASQPGLLPLINPSVGLMEILVARARAQKSRPVKVPILLIDALYLDSPGKDKVGAAVQAIDVTFLGADTVKFGNGASTDQLRVIIGTDGRSRGGASGSTAKDKFSFRPTSKPVRPSR